MADIRLDKSKPYSECRGERQPDDPHYNVAHWQGEKIKAADKRTGKPVTITVLLPFDASGELVPDDGKTAAWQAPNPESGKPALTHHPLWTDEMRSLLAKKQARAAKIAGSEEDEDEPTEDLAELSSEVNFAAWLRGEANYDWPLLQAAARARYSRVFQSKKQMVEDLVVDHKLVPEEQVCKKLSVFIPA